MQAISEVLGGKLVNQSEVKHGRLETINLNSSALLFKGLPEKINVGLYHSWKVEGLEDKFVSAISERGVVMAIESKDELLFGVQFHPESVLTKNGEQILSNFVQFVKNLKSI
jgi:anthranilate/para-aminobenzoate synthase component II